MPNDPKHDSIERSSFGLLGSTGVVREIRQDRVVVLTRPKTDCLDYQESPIGQGLDNLSWSLRHNDSSNGNDRYELQVPLETARNLCTLREWRAAHETEFPKQTISNYRAASTQQLYGIADALLAVAGKLHDQQWRLGLLTPDNLYLDVRNPAAVRVFLPDLGFAYLGDPKAGPLWLFKQTDDLTWWDEDRSLCQLTAPIQYRISHPALTGQDLLPQDQIQRDLTLIANLLRFCVTGQPTGRANGSESRFDRALARVSQYDSASESPASAMWKAVKDSLGKPPVDTNKPPPPPSPPRGRKLLVALGLVAALGGVGTWLYLSDWKEDGIPTDPTKKDVPPGTDKKPDEPKTPLSELQEKVKTASTIEAKAQAAIDLKAIAPNDPLVSKTRDELLEALKNLHGKIGSSGVAVLESQRLIDLWQKLNANP